MGSSPVSVGQLCRARRAQPVTWIKRPAEGAIDAGQGGPRCSLSSISDRQEASMADSEKKDTYGYLGNEPATLKELMSCLTAAVEKLVKTEGEATRAHLEK